MKISTLKLTIGISFLGCLAIICAFCCFESLIGALITCAVWAVFYVVMTKLFARCPYCKKPLSKNYLQEDLCPHCQMLLD